MSARNSFVSGPAVVIDEAELTGFRHPTEDGEP